MHMSIPVSDATISPKILIHCLMKKAVFHNQINDVKLPEDSTLPTVDADHVVLGRGFPAVPLTSLNRRQRTAHFATRNRPVNMSLNEL